jgi:arylsulfatase A-like enzyme
MFKQAYDPGFPWLPNNQVPTAGDWFRAAGYSSHYFGRHDFTSPPAPSLEEWGFSDWSLSWPSSQGGGPGNLGVFRDIGFADVANGFFSRKALGVETNIRNIYNSTNATTHTDAASSASASAPEPPGKAVLPPLPSDHKPTCCSVIIVAASALYARPRDQRQDMSVYV